MMMMIIINYNILQQTGPAGDKCSWPSAEYTSTWMCGWMSAWVTGAHESPRQTVNAELLQLAHQWTVGGVLWHWCFYFWTVSRAFSRGQLMTSDWLLKSFFTVSVWIMCIRVRSHFHTLYIGHQWRWWLCHRCTRLCKTSIVSCHKM